jgi:TonB family protein
MRFHLATPRRAVRLLTGTLLPLALLVPAVGAAQGPAAPGAGGDTLVTLSGTVRGPDGIGIANAEVTLTPRSPGVTLMLPRRLYSDDAGGFRFPALPRGDATIAVRRIGFKPTSIETKLPADKPVAVRLESAALALSPVIVNDRRTRYDGPMAEFNRRKDWGFGRFITRGQIDQHNPMRTSDMLRMVPGVYVQNTMRGTSLRIRGNTCEPLIWVDGTPALAGPFDLDTFEPNTVGGIEIYSGVAEVPVELRGPRGEERCGVIAVWTRMPERRPRKPKGQPITVEQLNALVASAVVYTADQVDRPAVPDSTTPLDPYYPDSLKQSRTPGTAVVEFVVDSTGHVETESINVVLASQPAFGRAAREAVFSARFIPAMLRGQTVRQIVQLPLEFKVASKK